MTDFPTRGQQAPAYWDNQLQSYIDEAVAVAIADAAAAQADADAAQADADAAQGTANTALANATDAHVAGYVEDDTPSATRAALDALYAGGGPAGTVRGFYFPEDYAAGSIVYPNDANTAVQAAIDAAYAAGGGIVLLSQLYGLGNSDIQIKNGVSVQGVGISGPQPSPTGFKAITGATGGRIRWGKFDGPGAHLYPGPISNFCIDGDNIAGGATELLRCECVETSAYDIHVMNSAGNGVDLASSQNVNFFNANFGSCTEGTALMIRDRSAGTQPPGHCVFYGGHLGDSKRTIVVTSHDASFFVGPHDNYFIGTIIETGRSAYDIDEIVRLEDGDTWFLNCVLTIGAQVTAINDNCSVRVSNDIRTTGSTVAVIQNTSIGGGAGAVKAAYGVRVVGGAGHVSNTVNYGGRILFANVTYGHCHDTSDGLVVADQQFIRVTALTDDFTTINGGTLTGVRRDTKVPVRYNGRSDTGLPLQVRRDTDTVANRWQLSRDGLMQWLDGAAGTVRGSLSRALLGGIHFMSMAGTWLIANGWGRQISTVNVAVDGPVTIDAVNTSHVLLNFTASGADVTSITVNNIYDGCRITLSIFGFGTNTITWPGTGAGGIVTRTTEPQPVVGELISMELVGLGGRLYEISR